MSSKCSLFLCNAAKEISRLNFNLTIRILSMRLGGLYYYSFFFTSNNTVGCYRDYLSLIVTSLSAATHEINNRRIYSHTRPSCHTQPCSVLHICWSSCGRLAIQTLLLNLERQSLCMITDDRSKASAATVSQSSHPV